MLALNFVALLRATPQRLFLLATARRPESTFVRQWMTLILLLRFRADGLGLALHWGALRFLLGCRQIFSSFAITLPGADAVISIALPVLIRNDQGSRMDRRDTVLALLALAAAPLAAEAQQATKVARIGYLSSSLASRPHLRDAFLQGMRDLGYVEGRNVVLEYRDAEGEIERIPALAAELVALKVDVIFVGGSTRVTLAAMQATKTIPIVFTNIGDPLESGVVTSLARPGGNVTGLSSLGPELVGKRLELLKQAVPGVDRVAVLWVPGALGERTDKDMLTGADVAARALGVRLQFVGARSTDEIVKAFSDMSSARAGALTLLPSNRFEREHSRLVDLAAKNKLPAVYPSREFVDAGGLMSYGANAADMHRRAAAYVDKILKGAKPGDLPVEQPTKFELVINLKTAKALGLTIPQSVLTHADEVIR